MKSGEKQAFKWVLAAMLGIVGLTVYLEIQHQGKHGVVSSAKTPESTTEPKATVTTVMTIPKGMIAEDLPDANTRGATVLTLYCAQCHDLPTPYMHTADEWPAILQRMSQHTQETRSGGGMMAHVMMPSKKDWETLKGYLNSHALTPIVATDFSDLDSPDGQSFMHACSQCHAAPSPASHNRKQWPRIVLRMKSNMMAAHVETPDADTLTRIIDYLQSHSSAG
jgi:cytochrome c5